MAEPGVEIMHAAILLTDMVGYGRHMETMEEVTLARLEALREELIGPVIARHCGEALKWAGNGAFIRFDSEFGTVRCAVEVQRTKAMTISDSSRLMPRTNPNKD